MLDADGFVRCEKYAGPRPHPKEKYEKGSAEYMAAELGTLVNRELMPELDEYALFHGGFFMRWGGSLFKVTVQKYREEIDGAPFYEPEEAEEEPTSTRPASGSNDGANAPG